MKNARLLRTALLMNSAFSLVSGASASWLAADVGAAIDMPTGFTEALGLMLVVYAGALYALARSPRLRSPWVLAATGLDFLWVVGSLAWLLLRTVPETWLVLGQAEVVLTFACLQLVGLRRAAGALRVQAA
jgi:hypothetical protein